MMNQSNNVTLMEVDHCIYRNKWYSPEVFALFMPAMTRECYFMKNINSEGYDKAVFVNQHLQKQQHNFKCGWLIKNG